MSRFGVCCCFIGFSLFSGVLHAQIKYGNIFDTQGSPVNGAVISIPGLLTGTKSNKEGVFQVNLKDGIYTFLVEAEGFLAKTEELICRSDTCYPAIYIRKNSISLDEVIVKSDGFEKRILDVPASVSVLNDRLLKETQSLEIKDIIRYVPNMTYGDLGVGYQQQIAIRGISVFSENPATATFIDGINAIHIAANNLLLTDIERIEILRGPQSTRYGRNALGGVINITTQKPSNNIRGSAQIASGNLGLQRYVGTVSGPLIQNKFFAGFATQYQKRKGYYYNDLNDQFSFDGKPLTNHSANGVRMGDNASIYANLDLRYFINKQWEAILNIKTQNDNSTGPSMYYQAASTPEMALQNPYKIRVNDIGSDQRNVINSGLSVSYNLPHFQFTSLTGVSYVKQQYHQIDQDLTAFDMAYGSSSYQNKLGKGFPMTTYTQEFKFNISNSEQFSWSGGLYTFRQLYEKQFATVYKNMGVLFGTEPGIYYYNNLQTNSGLASFGELNVAVTPAISFTFGLRADYEKRKALLFNQFENAGNPIETISDKKLLDKTFSAVSPKINLTFKPESRKTFYLAYNRGFRAGGLNGIESEGDNTSYQPEYSDNLETGFKLRSHSGHLILSTAAYLILWKNLQLDLRTPGEKGIWIISNVGDVISSGGEIEVSYKPWEKLYLDLKTGLIHARYQNFDYLDKNIQGNHTIFAPAYTNLLTARYVFATLRNTSVDLRTEYHVVGKQYFDLHNEIVQNPYQLLNSFLNFSNTETSISFWVKNLLNTKYITYAMPGYFKNTLINQPRTFGITITRKFQKK
jgi:iron complex outermembrane receptor protein